VYNYLSRDYFILQKLHLHLLKKKIIFPVYLTLLARLNNFIFFYTFKILAAMKKILFSAHLKIPSNIHLYSR